MTIGEALAEARLEAGLTVTEVSQLTRIRGTIIRGIENDDYSACGGDFYARGHIRSIAKVVGADPGPLIREYDTMQRGPNAITAAEAVRPATPIRPRRRRRLFQAVAVALVVALGFVVYHFLWGSRHAASAAQVAGTQPVTHRHAVRSSPNGAPKVTQTASPEAHTAVVQLKANRPCWVEFTTPSGGYLFRSYVAAGASKNWTFRRAVEMRLANPGSIRLTVDGRNPVPPGSATEPITLSLGPNRPATVTASPLPAVPVRTLTPVRAVAIGPYGGDQGDNPQRASLAIDSNPATAWQTDWYTTARFGNLYPGTGLLLDLGRPVAITGARITLGSAHGASFQLRVGIASALAHLAPVARKANAGGVVRLRLTTTAHGRYVLIWFTRLPPDRAGTFQASVRDVRLEGRA